jgi:hypothetical protein
MSLRKPVHYLTKSSIMLCTAQLSYKVCLFAHATSDDFKRTVLNLRCKMFLLSRMLIESKITLHKRPKLEFQPVVRTFFEDI